MRSMIRSWASIALALLLPAGLLASETISKNGSFELGPGPNGPDERKAADWTLFGPTAERSAEEALTGTHSLKIFGSDTTVGGFQDVAVNPGDAITISAMLYTRSTDKIGGDAAAKIKLEFYDASDVQIGSGTELTVLNGSSTPDVWTPGSIGPMTAPAGAAKARMVCVWTYTNTSMGSAYWDDCQLLVNGTDMLSNGSFETAGVSGQTPFGIDFWTGFGTQEKSQDVALDGTSSAKLHAGDMFGQFDGLFQDMVDLAAGDHIKIKAFVWNPSVGGLVGSASAAIKLEFFPTSGTTLPPPEEFLDFDANDPTEVWIPVTYVTTVPTDITLARIVILANDTDPNNGPVYVDTAKVTRSNSADPNAPDPNLNLLSNASFEDGTSGSNGLTNWTEFRGLGCQARKNAFEVPAIDGTSVLKISGDCVAGVYQDVPVFPGDTLTITAFFRSKATDPFGDPPGSTAGVKVEWVGGVVPPQIDIGDPSQNNTATAATPTDTWTQLDIDYVMPPGSAALARATVIISQGNSTDSVVYFDALEAVVTNIFDGADVDADGDEDLLDFAEFQHCFSGSGGGLGYPCMVFDSDEDNDVDLADLNFFLPRMTGP